MPRLDARATLGTGVCTGDAERMNQRIGAAIGRPTDRVVFEHGGPCEGPVAARGTDGAPWDGCYTAPQRDGGSSLLLCDEPPHG